MLPTFYDPIGPVNFPGSLKSQSYQSILPESPWLSKMGLHQHLLEWSASQPDGAIWGEKNGLSIFYLLKRPSISKM